MDDAFGDLLDGVYETVPSLANLVLFARKFNQIRGVDDEPENTLTGILSIVQMLCIVPIEKLEERHALMEEGVSVLESDTDSEESAIDVVDESPLLLKKISDVQSQLSKINQLDRELNEAYDRLENRIKENEKRLQSAESNLNADQSASDFGALFNNEGLPPLIDLPMPVPLERQTAEPARQSIEIE